MRSLNTWILSSVLFTIAAFYSVEPAAGAPVQDGPGSAQDADRPLVEPPDEPGDQPPPPPAAEDRPRRRVREPGPPDGRGPRHGRGIGAEGLGRGGRADRPFGRGGRAAGPHRRERYLLMERLLPLIAKDHPELARRLIDLRDNAPEEFERVLSDALAMRFEEALERAGRRSEPVGGQRPPGRPDWDDPESPEQHARFEREMRELHGQNEELERRSVELARRYRELRERREPGLQAEVEEVRASIERTANEHFDVRTELRAIELRRVEMELDRLRQMVERIREDLERREQARDSIMERRLRQLLGEEGDDW